MDGAEKVLAEVHPAFLRCFFRDVPTKSQKTSRAPAQPKILSSKRHRHGQPGGWEQKAPKRKPKPWRLQGNRPRGRVGKTG